MKHKIIKYLKMNCSQIDEINVEYCLKQPYNHIYDI